MEKFSDNICRKISPNEERYRTYYYDALPWANTPPTPLDEVRTRKKQHFLDRLKLLRKFEVRCGRFQKISSKCNHCGLEIVKFNQKLVDILISVDLVHLAWGKLVDSIAIVKGDSDITPAIRKAKEAGAMIYLIYDPLVYIQDDLKMIYDDRLEIDKELMDASILV